MKSISIGIIAFIFLFGTNSFAQKKDSILSYPLVVKFQSQCCGVPDQKPLDSAILLFKINNHIRSFKADKISPMGREGEYYIAFKESSAYLKHELAFTELIKKVSGKMKNPGYVAVEENVKINISDLPANAEITPIVF